jgi:hypothetical protein
MKFLYTVYKKTMEFLNGAFGPLAVRIRVICELTFLRQTDRDQNLDKKSMDSVSVN